MRALQIFLSVFVCIHLQGELHKLDIKIQSFSFSDAVKPVTSIFLQLRSAQSSVRVRVPKLYPTMILKQGETGEEEEVFSETRLKWPLVLTKVSKIDFRDNPKGRKTPYIHFPHEVVSLHLGTPRYWNYYVLLFQRSNKFVFKSAQNALQYILYS